MVEPIDSGAVKTERVEEAFSRGEVSGYWVARTQTLYVVSFDNLSGSEKAAGRKGFEDLIACEWVREWILPGRGPIIDTSPQGFTYSFAALELYEGEQPCCILCRITPKGSS